MTRCFINKWSDRTEDQPATVNQQIKFCLSIFLSLLELKQSPGVDSCWQTQQCDAHADLFVSASWTRLTSGSRGAPALSSLRLVPRRWGGEESYSTEDCDLQWKIQWLQLWLYLEAKSVFSIKTLITSSAHRLGTWIINKRKRAY